MGEYILDPRNYGQCLRCGRKLKTEESRLLGMGKTCYKKYMTENTHKKLFELEGNKQMEMIEYQKLARTTENKTLSDFDRIRNGCYGLCGESGECIDLLKKHEFQGHELDKEKLLDELGDVMWYISQTAAGLGITMEDIACHNISKLKKRYPEGFEANKSINRKEDK